MDRIWELASLLLFLIAIWQYKDGNIAVANQECIMAFLAQILAKMEGIEK